MVPNIFCTPLLIPLIIFEWFYDINMSKQLIQYNYDYVIKIKTEEAKRKGHQQMNQHKNYVLSDIDLDRHCLSPVLNIRWS